MEGDAVSRILVVDDDARLAESVRSNLDAEGYAVTILDEAVSAVAHINAEHYDLVLVDIVMPGISGLQLLDAIDRQSIDAAFIMMTDDVSTDTAVESLRRGAVDYIRKPCEPCELLLRVRNALEQRRLRRQHHAVNEQNRELQAHLWQARKEETIGTLTAGIAHDFNNILGIILGNTELAREELAPQSDARTYLDNVVVASHRAREVINRLLTFSMSREPGWKPVELGSILAESLEMVRSSVPDNVTIHRSIPASAFFVQGDATQIHQIILNLCTNAIHAMEPNGGTLEVKLNRVELDPHSGAPEGAYMKISVIDTGHGISPEIMDRIFDPYFTTNESGRGGGMGLAVVQGIVTNHGGSIRVSSEPGLGTRFDVLLPLSQDTADVVDIPEDKAEDSGPGKRIMLVDDEQMIVDVIGRMLRRLDYEVTAFTSAEEALERFAASPNDFDLVITDLAMPRMNGVQLASALQETRQSIPIMACSGFNERLDGATLRASGIRRFVKKPVGMKELDAAIKALVGGTVSERRRQRRFTVGTGAFVIVESSLSEPARLLDVSRSGLSFAYDQSAGEPGQVERLSIISAETGFVVDQIPYETVSDMVVDDGSSTPRRRRGIKFERLTASQLEKLDAFIVSHTTH